MCLGLSSGARGRWCCCALSGAAQCSGAAGVVELYVLEPMVGVFGLFCRP